MGIIGSRSRDHSHNICIPSPPKSMHLCVGPNAGTTLMIQHLHDPIYIYIYIHTSSNNNSSNSNNNNNNGNGNQNNTNNNNDATIEKKITTKNKNDSNNDTKDHNDNTNNINSIRIYMYIYIVMMPRVLAYMRSSRISIISSLSAEPWSFTPTTKAVILVGSPCLFNTGLHDKNPPT